MNTKYVWLGIGVIYAMIIALATMTFAKQPPETHYQEGSWEEYIYGEWEDVVLHDGKGILMIDAPYRAMDGSDVPVMIGTDKPGFVKLTLIIDENPTPCCATFEFDSIPAMVETNIRINAYTNIRLIGEDINGDYYMVTKYIKSAGGCSAPVINKSNRIKGSMDIMVYEHKTEVDVYHPNYSGMQFDTLTGAEIPAEYIERLTVLVDGKDVFKYQGTIGIAQDVYFKLPVVPETYIEVYAEDNLGNQFEFHNNGY